ncbi:MAG: XkdX family protein [Clostridia bacterium]|nr:XkdX family protein [Clostridia bacterium]
MKEKITKWYKQGLWTAEMIENAVRKGVITNAEFQEIINSKG